MRILEVCPYDLRRAGGVQQQVRTLAQGFKARGHDAIVAGPAGEIDLGHVMRIPANGSVAPIAVFPDRRVLAAAARDVDVVHLHEPLAPRVGWAALRLDTPVIGTFHRDGASLPYRVLGAAMRGRLERLAAATAVSPLAAETIERVAGRSVMIVPNGLALQDFSADTLRQGNRVVFVGRHEPRKGLGVLIEAVARVTLECDVVVVGDGPDSARLRAATDDPRIRFVGVLDREDLITLLASAAIAVVPSLCGESFGLVLLEAMAAGCAVVASDLPAHRFVLGDPPAGMLVPPGSAEGLAKVITELVEAPTRVQALGEAARERAGFFAIDRTIERYLAIFREILINES